MYDVSDCGLLIVAFARAGNVKEIINTAKSSGIKRIYIALDVSEIDSNIQVQQIQIRNLVNLLNSEGELSVKLLERTSNVGCSANLLSGIDWAFEYESYLAVVEDDCLPVEDFYLLISRSRVILEKNPNVWIVGGTQVAPTRTNNQALLSRYPITWGWATSRNNWFSIRAALVDGSKSFKHFKGSGLRRTESLYWRSGARRSYAGIIDAWDIPLALAFIRYNKLCILPSESLVRNVGDDFFAMHTTSDSPGIRVETGHLHDVLENLERSFSYEKWIRENHYKIRRRHLVTNNLRRFLDSVTSIWKIENRKPLIQRWRDANH